MKDVSQSPVFTAYVERATREYEKLSPTPSEFKPFLDNISTMWATEPHFSDGQLRAITVPTWIVDGDRDEAIKREDTDHMAALIPGAGELILPAVSHFAFIQDPAFFNAALLASWPGTEGRLPPHRPVPRLGPAAFPGEMVGAVGGMGVVTEGLAFVEGAQACLEGGEVGVLLGLGAGAGRDVGAELGEIRRTDWSTPPGWLARSTAPRSVTRSPRRRGR